MKNTLFEQLPFDFKDSVIHAITSNNHESIYFKDIHSRFTMMSQYMVNYFNLGSVEECIGKSDFDFFTRQHAQQAYEDEQEIIRTQQPILGKVEMETWENDMISYVVTSKYPLYDIQGKLIGTWGHSINIALSNENHSDLKIPKAKALEQSFDSSNSSIIDSLTGLKNVKAFYEFMNLFYQDSMNSLSIPDKEHFLVLIDLKNFKTVNEAFGHDFGSNAIAFVGNLLMTRIGEHTELFRYGGDEFAMLIKNHSFSSILDICNTLLHDIASAEFTFKDNTTNIYACMGISRFKESLPFGNIHDIINQTEKRLFEAKMQQAPTIIYNNSYKY